MPNNRTPIQTRKTIAATRKIAAPIELLTRIITLGHPFRRNVLTNKLKKSGSRGDEAVTEYSPISAPLSVQGGNCHHAHESYTTLPIFRQIVDCGESTPLSLSTPRPHSFTKALHEHFFM